MGSEWQPEKLGYFIEIKTGFPFKSAHYSASDDDIRLLRGDNVIQGAFRWENVKRWPKNKIIEKHSFYHLQTGDVILAMDRPWIEAGLKTAQIQKIDLPCLLVQRVARLRSLPGLNQDFLRYLISSYGFTEYVKQIQTGTAVPHISTKQIESFEFLKPPIEAQEKIASILKSLDNKIELNRQINTTLETMAQALFKSWFVDFDPVIDNALAAGNPIPDELAARAERRKQTHDRKDASSSEHFKPGQPLPAAIQQQFPDRFVFTEALGWVPEGWSVSEVGAVLDLAYGKSLPARERIPGDIPVFGSGGASGFHNQKLVSGPGIVVGRKGTVGSLYWIEGDFFPIDTVFYVVKKTDIPLYWLFQSLALMDIKSMGADSAVPGVNRNVIYARKTTVPSLNIFEQYAAQVDSYNVRKKALQLQTSALEETRDTLLPKLLSGQLRIPEAEQQVAEII